MASSAMVMVGAGVAARWPWSGDAEAVKRRLDRRTRWWVEDILVAVTFLVFGDWLWLGLGRYLYHRPFHNGRFRCWSHSESAGFTTGFRKGSQLRQHR